MLSIITQPWCGKGSTRSCYDVLACLPPSPPLVYVSRRGPGQEYVKSTLGDIIQKLLAYDKSLEVDPLKIYQEMIDNEEVQRPAEANKLLQEVLRVACLLA